MHAIIFSLREVKNMLIGAGFLDTFKESLMSNFGPALAGLLGAVLLVYGVIKIAQGIMTQQQRGSHLAWGGIAFIVGAVFLGSGIIKFVQDQGSGTAKTIGLTS